MRGRIASQGPNRIPNRHKLRGMEQSGLLRIGELSRRVGVTPELLRAWEKRYGLLSPSRTAGGLRLYSARDEFRIGRMRELLASGLSAAEAARLAREAESAGPARVGAEEFARGLREALDHFDETGAQLALDRMFAAVGVDAALRDVVIPYLHELGERWAVEEATVGQEHFASNVIQGRLRALARGWDQGVGPRAVLACPPGELHEIGLICFGLSLRERGWRITYLGADTPVQSIETNLSDGPPAVTVVAAVDGERFRASSAGLGRVARKTPIAIAGAGADAAIAKRLGARYLDSDPVNGAATVAASPDGGGR
jgi:MerR family transcriptional regulator, light-induced transcriptional regulator